MCKDEISVKCSCNSGEFLFAIFNSAMKSTKDAFYCKKFKSISDNHLTYYHYYLTN